jgi:hypothetical protein
MPVPQWRWTFLADGAFVGSDAESRASFSRKNCPRATALYHCSPALQKEFLANGSIPGMEEE